jgi:hypothetical protein
VAGAAAHELQLRGVHGAAHAAADVRRQQREALRHLSCADADTRFKNRVYGWPRRCTNSASNSCIDVVRSAAQHARDRYGERTAGGARPTRRRADRYQRKPCEEDLKPQRLRLCRRARLDRRASRLVPQPPALLRPGRREHAVERHIQVAQEVCSGVHIEGV